MLLNYPDLKYQTSYKKQTNCSMDNVFLEKGDIIVKIADTEEEILAALELRFKVFNLELDEGIASSYLTGRDEDKYDRQCDHLIVKLKSSNKLIGTYRMQTYEKSVLGCGFYSNTEFKLSMLPIFVLKNSTELGRVCIDKGFRNQKILFLLWCGIARYINAYSKRYLFGCCSLSSQNPDEGHKLWMQLNRHNKIHARHELQAQDNYKLEKSNQKIIEKLDNIPIPPILGMYLRYGAKIVGEPAIDFEFKTIDFFVLLDTHTIPNSTYNMFMQL